MVWQVKRECIMSFCLRDCLKFAKIRVRRRRVARVQCASLPRIGMHGAKPGSRDDVPLPVPNWMGRKQAFR